MLRSSSQGLRAFLSLPKQGLSHFFRCFSACFEYFCCHSVGSTGFAVREGLADVSFLGCYSS